MAQEGKTLGQRKAGAAAGVAASEALLPVTAAASRVLLAEKEAASHARKRELLSQPRGGAVQDARAAKAAEQWRVLRPKPGQLLDESQSRAILLLYFHLVGMGERPERAVDKVAAAFGVSKGKIYAVSIAADVLPVLHTIIHVWGIL